MSKNQKAFEYITPTETSREKIVELREHCKDLSFLVCELIPDCRERSLAITKLEEFSMWANKAIVITQ